MLLSNTVRKGRRAVKISKKKSLQFNTLVLDEKSMTRGETLV